ncbi:MAG TPA: hypothetical protein VGM77_06060 [Gemmatimonadales bacterium]|jgi:hypothetical protein
MNTSRRAATYRLSKESRALKRLLAAGVITIALVLGAHQWRTIGGRVPMVFVALWFGSATMVALVFSPDLIRAPAVPRAVPGVAAELWRAKMTEAVCALLPLTLIPLLERHGVNNDPAVWLLDCALIISLCTVPYFTLLARSVLGGVVLSIGAFQALWTCGASALFVLMLKMEKQKTGQMPQHWTFEDFFRPGYRYLFLSLCAVMILGYCPLVLRAGRRRFNRQVLREGHAAV